MHDVHAVFGVHFEVHYLVEHFNLLVLVEVFGGLRQGHQVLPDVVVLFGAQVLVSVQSAKVEGVVVLAVELFVVVAVVFLQKQFAFVVEHHVNVILSTVEVLGKLVVFVALAHLSHKPIE